MVSAQIPLIWRALSRHRLAAGIIALQVAVSSAVLCNAGYLAEGRLQATAISSGVDEPRLGMLRIEGLDQENFADVNARIKSYIRNTEGVDSVFNINTMPFGPSELIAGVFLDDTQKHFGGVLNFYLGEHGSAEAMGLHIVSGRFPLANEYTQIDGFVPKLPSILITEQLASHFWPGENPLGKKVWCFDTVATVVGVVKHLSVPRPGTGEEEGEHWSVFVPALPSKNSFGTYLIRTTLSEDRMALERAQNEVSNLLPDAVIVSSVAVKDLRDEFLRGSKSVAAFLSLVILGVMMFTGLGIVGLASFWVTQRRAQIGIRRALGATSRDILIYFQIENAMIVGCGVVAGSALAVVINLLAMNFYEIPRMPLFYLPTCAVVMLLLGQISVLKPAIEASRILPVDAMRG